VCACAASSGGGRADALLDSADLVTAAGCEQHNTVHELNLHLGARGSDAVWMLGLMPYVPALSRLSALPDDKVAPGAFARAIAAFDEQIERAGYVEGGDVVVPLRWRMLCARRPLLP
jgi:hypothetical protein